MTGDGLELLPICNACATVYVVCTYVKFTYIRSLRSSQHPLLISHLSEKVNSQHCRLV